MDVAPHTQDEWRRLLLFPFKAYVVIAYLMAMMFSRGLRVDATVLWILLGYAVSFLVLLFVAVDLAFRGRRAEAFSSIGFAGLAVLLGCQLLSYLAS